MAIVDLRKNMEEVKSNLSNQQTGIMSGIQALDNTLLGFKKGEVITIGGRPGMGKSSLARGILLNVGAPERGWGTVLYCTMEMSCEEVVELLAANLAKINYFKYKKGDYTDKVKSLFDRACAQLSTYNVIINDDSYITPDSIRELLKEVSKNETIACLIIDYLQLMSLRRRVENRQEEVSEISRELKAIAREFELPVISLSQLNRNVETRESMRPRMSDIRESGSMENDSHKVILIHRPSRYYMSIDSNAEDTGEAELIVCKNRSGPEGIIQCAFIGEWMGFEDVPGTEIKEEF